MTSQALLYVLLREIPDNPDVLRLYGEGSHQLEAIAHVLASDQRLSDAKQVTFIVRSQPSPLLGVLGYFDAAQQPRIEMLPSQIARSLQYLRYVDYDSGTMRT